MNVIINYHLIEYQFVQYRIQTKFIHLQGLSRQRQISIQTLRRSYGECQVDVIAFALLKFEQIRYAVKKFQRPAIKKKYRF